MRTKEQKHNVERESGEERANTKEEKRSGKVIRVQNRGIHIKEKLKRVTVFTRVMPWVKLSVICFSFKASEPPFANEGQGETQVHEYSPFVFLLLEYVHVRFSSFAELNSFCFLLCPDAVPFVFISLSLHHSLTAWLLEWRQAITFLLHNTTAVIFSITNLPSLSTPRSVYFFPSHWPPLPAITDCFSHHLSPPHPSGNCITPSERSTIEHFPTPIILSLSHPPFSFGRPPPPAFSLPLLPLFTTHPRLCRYASPPLSSSSPPPPKKAPHALAAAEEVASLQTRKIHLEQPAASLAPSELS